MRNRLGALSAVLSALLSALLSAPLASRCSASVSVIFFPGQYSIVSSREVQSSGYIAGTLIVLSFAKFARNSVAACVGKVHQRQRAGGRGHAGYPEHVGPQAPTRAADTRVAKSGTTLPGSTSPLDRWGETGSCPASRGRETGRDGERR